MMNESKSSRSSKGNRCLFVLEEYADDIHPYATFELNENSRDSKGCILIPTLERRRSSNQGQWNQNAVCEKLFDKQFFKKLRNH